MDKTKVIFLREPYPDYMDSMRGEVEIGAFFPEEPQSFNTILCYAHVGQHSGASRDYMKSLEPATKNEYQSLLDELQSIGYELEIINEH
jgi:hypothetical protein